MIVRALDRTSELSRTKAEGTHKPRSGVSKTRMAHRAGRLERGRGPADNVGDGEGPEVVSPNHPKRRLSTYTQHT